MNANNEWEARFRWTDAKKWENFHRYEYDIDDIGDIFPPLEIFDLPSPKISDVIKAYNAATTKLQSLIGDMITEQKRLRALGSGWSFSEVAVTDGRLLNTWNLNSTFPMPADFVSQDYSGKAVDLYFAQCGAKIFHLTDRLENRGRSLKTSGASNGQTIVGAMSTGTHGSALDVGAVPDYIVGLHLIFEPSRHVWLERSSYPVVSDAFAGELGAELVRDDVLFNAALVSFGSFGIIHGVLIETESIYLLEKFSYRMPFRSNDKLKKAIHTLDVSELQLPHGSERPYHFSLIVNPHNLEWAYITTIYKQKYDKNYVPPEPDAGGLGLGDNLAAFLGGLLDAAENFTPFLANRVFESGYKGTFDRPSFDRGTLGDIFSFTSPRGEVASMAIGVPLEEATRTLEVILKVHKQEGPPFPGAFGIRYVPKSSALLGFTKFDTTCIVELDGVRSDNTQEFYENVLSRLDEEQPEYTLHWGKVNDHLDGQILRRMFGSDLDLWLDSRKKLLDESSRKVFSSPFLERCGLAE